MSRRLAAPGEGPRFDPNGPNGPAAAAAAGLGVDLGDVEQVVQNQLDMFRALQDQIDTQTATSISVGELLITVMKENQELRVRIAALEQAQQPPGGGAS